MSYNSNRTGRNKDNRTRSTLVLSQAEAVVGDGTWKSPGTYIVELDPSLTKNIDYTGGSAEYTGEDDIQIKLISTITTKATNANTTVLMTGGINSSEDLTQVIEHNLTTGNDAKELTSVFISNWSKGQTLDFFVNASGNITLEKGEWIITRYDG